MVLQGSKTLEIEEERITIGAGDPLEAPPRINPILHTIEAPCRGITISVPAYSGEKV